MEEKDLAPEKLEEIGEEIFQLTKSELEEIMCEVLPKVKVDTDEVQSIILDKKEYQKGIKRVSELCGMISGVMAVGLSKDQALELCQNVYLTKENSNNDLKKVPFAPVQL